MTRDAWHDSGFARNWDESSNLQTNPDRLRQLTLVADLVAAANPDCLLDLGVGSAQVEFVIRQRHLEFFNRCHVIGIDASAAMLSLAQERCESEGLSNVEFIEGDFKSLESLQLSRKPDAAICVQALHEVPHAVKQAVFKRVHDWLPPGAPFYILDRFAYSDTPWGDDWKAVWNWMSSQVSGKVIGFEEYHDRYSAKTDHIASVQEYRTWLEAEGFDTLCPYQSFNRAMIIARRRPA